MHKMHGTTLLISDLKKLFTQMMAKNKSYGIDYILLINDWQEISKGNIWILSLILKNNATVPIYV